MGYWQNELIRMQEEVWQVRVGQLETLLSFFGTLCSISVERTDGVSVYIQARRAGDLLQVEAVSDTYLPARAHLTKTQHATMKRLGWTLPGTGSPNYTRTVTDVSDLHRLALTLADTFQEAYGVTGRETWVVTPPEFGHAGAGLEAFGLLDLDDREVDRAVGTDTTAGTSDQDPLRVLRDGAGITLAAVIASDAVTFDDCLTAGLPRGDRLAEMAMLYREDCPIPFLRKSSFHLHVLRDDNLPLPTALALLATNPSAHEIELLGARADIDHAVLANAAVRGHRLAQWRGRRGGWFLRSAVMPVARLREIACQHDEEAAAMLRHPQCPDDIVLRHLLSRTARVRYAALLATKNRNLPIDSAHLRAARDLPMVERPGTTYPFTDRVRTIADQILATR